ncbi:murinoglobulin-1-like [Etheostoma spectabile]|uniref:murinoglobulin-1-like n=1 Tax=Etheostoma spectabile TaxID=54343 RepID=UPI0013AF7F62|nr:murinoglobulin-1-like [Etheostoma spectabile]
MGIMNSSLDVKKKDEPLSCDKEEDIFIQYTVVGEAQGFVDVMYLITDIHSLPVFSVPANSADFSTEQCFSHKVSLEFSPSSAVPGEETIMQVTTQPESLCGVSAVDQSVLIKEPGKTLDANKIFQLLPVKKISYIPYDVQDSVECLHVRPRRYVLPYPNGGGTTDAYTVFQNVGMKMATNLVIREPSCLKYKGREYHQGHGGVYGVGLRYHSVPTMARMEDIGPAPAGAVSSGMSSPDKPPIVTVRTFFPETWIWDLVEVGESGNTAVAHSTVPGHHQPLGDGGLLSVPSSLLPGAQHALLHHRGEHCE